MSRPTSRPGRTACALVLLGGLLAGCGRQEQTAAPAAVETPSAAPVASALATGASPSTAVAGAMTGQVSSLTGARSGLNVRVTDFGTVVDLPSDALFEYDKAELTPAAEIELRKAADLIRGAPAGAIQVIGHTDSHGADAYNQTLSEARARTVADWFAQQVGVRQRAFQVAGKGEIAPIAPNETASGADDPRGRAKNRRVEVVLPKG